MIEQTVGKYRRRILFQPGFDWRKDNPSRDYGIRSMEIAFFLIGPDGAVDWSFATDWYPKSARDHLEQFQPRNGHKPDGRTLGYHSYKPMYEDQKEKDDCSLLAGGKCYTDCSFTNSDLLIEGFLNGGDEWVWNRLEAYYEHVFNGKDWPSFTPIIEPHPDERQEVLP